MLKELQKTGPVFVDLAKTHGVSVDKVTALIADLSAREAEEHAQRGASPEEKQQASAAVKSEYEAGRLSVESRPRDVLLAHDVRVSQGTLSVARREKTALLQIASH